VLIHCQRLGLIIFTRYPEPGQAKTRLIPALGITQATQLHQRMAEHTLHQAQTLAQHLDQGLEITVWFRGGNAGLMRAWLGAELNYQSQPDGDLGLRLVHALTNHFDRNVDHNPAPVLIIGTDCPSLTPALLAQAYCLLENHDLVIGPAMDGGYYLISMKKLIPELFENIPWSSDQVLVQTLGIAERLLLTTVLLPPQTDIDRPEDLPFLAQAGFSDWLQ